MQLLVSENMSDTVKRHLAKSVKVSAPALVMKPGTICSKLYQKYD